MKLCKDCVHAIPQVTGFFGKKEYNTFTRCKKKVAEVDYVSGNHKYAYADTVREFGTCGKEGKFWEKGGSNV